MKYILTSDLSPLQNEPITDKAVPKKVYVRTKTRVKPPPEKIMVKRETGRNTLASLEEENMIEIDDEEEDDEDNADFSLIRSHRSIRTFHEQNQLSPMSVIYAKNYDKKEHKGWVKPLFSSIVYRLPVSYEYCFSFS